MVHAVPNYFEATNRFHSLVSSIMQEQRVWVVKEEFLTVPEHEKTPDMFDFVKKNLSKDCNYGNVSMGGKIRGFLDCCLPDSPKKPCILNAKYTKEEIKGLRTYYLVRREIKHFNAKYGYGLLQRIAQKMEHEYQVSREVQKEVAYEIRQVFEVKIKRVENFHRTEFTREERMKINESYETKGKWYINLHVHSNAFFEHLHNAIKKTEEEEGNIRLMVDMVLNSAKTGTPIDFLMGTLETVIHRDRREYEWRKDEKKMKAWLKYYVQSTDAAMQDLMRTRIIKVLGKYSSFWFETYQFANNNQLSDLYNMFRVLHFDLKLKVEWCMFIMKSLVDFFKVDVDNELFINRQQLPVDQKTAVNIKVGRSFEAGLFLAAGLLGMDL